MTRRSICGDWDCRKGHGIPWRPIMQAHPKRRDDVRLVAESVVALVVIWALVVAASVTPS